MASGFSAALAKALIIDTDSGLSIPVMFNPPEYQIQKTNQFAEVGIPGLGSSLLQFVRGNSETLNLELFFDSTDTGQDVRTFTGPMVALTSLNARTHAPPRLIFIWASLIFPCVLESVTQRFEYFAADGRPLRARLTVTLKGSDLLETLLGSVPLESADRAKARVVKGGETLQSIAAHEYDDPRRWRAIAEATNIDNPLTINAGLMLRIPALS